MYRYELIEDESRDLVTVEPGSECLRHRAAEASADQRDVRQLQRFEGVLEAIRLPPVRGVRWPGMRRLAVAEHVEGVDRAPRSSQPRQYTLPGERAARQVM